MNLRDAFNSMAVQVFLILAIGMSVAALAGFSVADIGRRQLAEKRYDDRVADRVVDSLLTLSRPSEPQARLAKPGPPGVLEFSGPVSGRSIDSGATDSLKTRLALQPLGQVTVYDPEFGDCTAPPPPPPPLPPPLSSSPLSDTQKPEKAASRDRTAACRVVAVSGEGAAKTFLVSVPPFPADEARPLNGLVVLTIVIAAAGLAYAVALITTAPIRRLAKAAIDLGADLERPPLSISRPAEVKQAADAFNHMQDRIRETMRERTFMLAAITHDLQTPLTRQRLRLDTLTDDATKTALLEDYRIMQELIRDGLELARAGAGSARLEPLDLHSLLESVTEDMASLDLPVMLERSATVTVEADPTALRRCLVNLVDNAVKYGRRAHVNSRVDGNHAIVSVSDEGPGIDAAWLDRVTQPFVRVAGSDVQLGTGLGLAIAQILAERNGSRLVLENASIGGLTVSLALTLVTDKK